MTYNRDTLQVTDSLTYYRSITEEDEDCDEKCFFIAAFHDDIDSAEYLLSCDDFPKSPALFTEALHIACCFGSLAFVQKLREWYPELDIRTKHDEAFRLACEGGHAHVAEQLYDWDHDIDTKCIQDYASLSDEVKYFFIDRIWGCY